MTQTTVISNKKVSSNAYLLELGRKPPFRAGQMVSLWIDNTAEARLYSMAGGEQEPSMKILFEVVHQGVLSNRMKQLKPGDVIHCSEPMGEFINTSKPAVWIATGTGIAPFLSMLASGDSENKTLLHGSRTLENFFFQEMLKSKMGNRYLRFCTTQSGDGIIFGRITHYLEQEKNFEPNILYYLCGNNQMVIDVREILIRKGVGYENIKAEIYF